MKVLFIDNGSTRRYFLQDGEEDRQEICVIASLENSKAGDVELLCSNTAKTAAETSILRTLLALGHGELQVQRINE